MSKNLKNDIRSFFKSSTVNIEKKPEISSENKAVLNNQISSKKRSVKEKVIETKAGESPKKYKKTKQSKSREISQEKKDIKKENNIQIKKEEIINNCIIPKKSIIIEDEEDQEEIKIDIKPKTEKILTKPDKPNLKIIDPKEFFGSNYKKTGENESKNSPKKTNPIKKTPKKISDDSYSEESIKKEKSNKKTPIKNKRRSSHDEDDMEESSTIKRNSKSSGKKVKKIEDSNDGGKTFVLTGILPLERNSLEDILKSLGAKCTKSVSKKTNYLVYGETLEDGRSVITGKKYQTADKLGTKKLNFIELESLLRELLDSNFDLSNATLDNLITSKTEKIEPTPLAAPKSYLKKKDDSIEISKMDVINEIKEKKEVKKEMETIVMKDKSSENQILWTAKHAPQTMEEIIGNGTVVKKLVQWLSDWDSVILKGNSKEMDTSSYKGGRTIENVNARAVLISGPPGIGKTSTVRLIAKLNNYKTFELNASDQRNKGIVNQKVGFLMNNFTLSSCEESNSKNLIIMDEIDGMAGNEDRGGISALIDIIKKTKIPIICICNDHQSQKLKSLIKSCYDLKFSKPDKRQISKRLIEICKMENFDVESNAVEYLCESVGNDIRQCLNFLELWSRKSNDLKFKDIKQGYNKYSKDNGLMISNFSAAQKMLNKNEMKNLKFFEKLALYFVDYDLIPLLIHENYLSCYNSKPTSSDMETMYRSAEHISFADVIDKNIRIKQEWNLLGNRGIHSCVAPAIYSGNFIPFPAFPQLLGKISKIRKIIRQLKELKQCFPNHSLRAIKEEMVPLMLSKITNILNDFGKEGVDHIINLLTQYKFTITMFKENLIEIQSNESLIKRYEKVTPSLKTSLTKKYNECFKTSMIKRKRKDNKEVKVKFDEDGDIIDALDQSGEEEEKEDDDEVIIKEAKKTTKKTKK